MWYTVTHHAASVYPINTIPNESAAAVFPMSGVSFRVDDKK